MKRITPSRDSVKPLDDLRDSYDPKLRYMVLKVTVPVDLKPKLPIPKELADEGGFLYVFTPRPSRDCRNLFINKVEGHQCTIISRYRCTDIS